MRWIVWFALVALPLLAYASVGDRHVRHAQWTDQFDPLFRKYAKYYFGPHIDWHWFKAQGIAESGLQRQAKSPVGAVGLMQIMPATYADISKELPYLAEIDEPRWNIAAAVYYDRQLYRKWKRKPPLQSADRLAFAFASYNAGYGSMLRAIKRAAKDGIEVRSWADAAPYAPSETRAYVARITRLMENAP